MADFPTWQPPQGPTPLQTLSGVMGLQTQRQQLQLQQQELQRSQVETQQNLGVNQFFSDWSPGDHHGDDGTLDIDSAHSSPAYQALPGVARVAVDAKLNALKGQQLQNKQQLSTLNGQVVDQFGKLAQALSANSDPGEIKNQLTAFAQQGPDQARIAGIYGPMLQKVPPQNLGVALKTMAAQAQDVSAQQAQTNPAQFAVNTGGATKVYNVNKATGLQPGQQPAGEITNTLAPQVITMPDQTLRTVGGAYGTPPGAGNGGNRAPAPPPGAPRTAAQDAPPSNSPKAVIDAYQTATQQANEHVSSIRNADADYGTNSLIANQIRKLSQSTDTGPGTQTWHHVLGALGAPVGSNNVADYQLLGAYLDRQAAGARSAMGLPNTNQGTTESKAIAGNTEYQGKALQDKNDLTQSLVEGVHQYREGLDRVAGFSGQASPQAINQFRSSWAANFDPNVFKGELAYKRSKAEGDAFVKSLSPQEAQSLAAKRQALQGLSQGQVPQ